MTEDPKKRLREGVDYLEAQQNNQIAQTQIAQTQTAQTIVAKDVVAQTAAQKNNVAQTIIAKDITAQTPAQKNNVAVTQMAQTIVAVDIVSRNRDAIAAKRLSRVDAMTTPNLKPLPTWDAGYDSSGRRLVQTLGQDPVAVGRPVSTGAIGTGDRTYNTGNAVDVIPHIKPVDVVPVRIQDPSDVKILFSVTEGSDTVFYVGGDRDKPKELFRSATYTGFRRFLTLVNTGKGLNKFFWQKADRPDFVTSNLIDSRYPDQVFNTGVGARFQVNFPPYQGEGVYLFADQDAGLGDPVTTTFYRNGETINKVESPEVYYSRVWLGEINETSFFDSYTPFPDISRLEAKIPIFTQSGYTFASRTIPGGTFSIYSQRSDGAINTFVEIPEADTLPTNYQDIYAATLSGQGRLNTITGSGILHTLRTLEGITPETKSLAFLTLNLNSGATGEKTAKIFPLKNQGTAFEVHSISYTP
jgi:hypothetical protein